MNINEIARLAEVSRATVSRYLNQGYVSEEKKERIKKVIEETGYNPSSQAQMLRTKKTKLIGVIIPKLNSESISRMVNGIGLVLSKEGYQLLLANTQNDVKEELKYLNTFKSNQVDGIIFIGTIFTKEHKRLLEETKVPVVILGQWLSGYSCVYYDDYNAAKDLSNQLLQSAKKAVYLGVTKKDEAAGHNRTDGFLAAYRMIQSANGREIKKPMMLETDFTMEAAYHRTKEAFEQEADLDTVICATDTIAIGALQYLHEKNIKVPDQVQLAGIGDTAIGNVVSPKLTTVHYYYKTSGIEAANMLLEMLQTGEYVRKEIKMGYKLLMRDSTR
ncbi:MAG: LacI family DNA-binding transcriptional regulator [bacterium]|nr:LacI family DNA-binding transcriptional regulator [bacterium]